MKNNDIPVLAVDGPSGSGKGTITRSVASRLGWHLLDSGALYRLLALVARMDDVSSSDHTGLAWLATNLDVKFDSDASGNEQIFLRGKDVTVDIRSEDCGRQASEVAAIPAVRRALVALQTRFKRAPGLVADGRDMGTVIFPEAQVKIFLTADPDERAQRRYKQLKEKGMDVSLAALRDDIARRDERDSQRAVSPLVAADDAIQVDTTGLSIVEVVHLVMHITNHEFNLDL